jgi:hypothetical protein
MLNLMVHKVNSRLQNVKMTGFSFNLRSPQQQDTALSRFTEPKLVKGHRGPGAKESRKQELHRFRKSKRMFSHK